MYYPPHLELFIVDLVPLRDEDSGQHGFYYGVCSADPDMEWKGGAVYWSLDGSTYELLAPIKRQAIICKATTTLASYGGTGKDTTNTVTVELLNGTLESKSTSEVLEGANHMMLAGELFAFETATLVSGRTYTLSNLYRYRRGTSYTHAANEQGMLIDHRVQFKGLDWRQAAKTRYFKAAANGQELTNIPAITATLTGKTLGPKLWGDFGQLVVKSIGDTTPPSTPTNGDAYIVGASATGAWNGWDDSIAVYYDQWVEIVPIEGWRVYVEDMDDIYFWDGSSWISRESSQTLTDGTNIAWDTKSGRAAEVVLGGNRTLDAPTNLQPGQVYSILIQQDGTGSRTLTWAAPYKWAGGTAPTLSTGAGAKDMFLFVEQGGDLVNIGATLDIA